MPNAGFKKVLADLHYRTHGLDCIQVTTYVDTRVNH